MAAVALHRLTLAAAGAVVPTLAAAHDERLAASGPGEPEAWLLIVLAAGLLGYAGGLAALWRQAGLGRGLSVRQAAAFGAGWALLCAALVSPLDDAALRQFWLHMVQHELLMLGAAPLIVAGAPLAVWAWALPRRAVQRLAAPLRHGAWRAGWSAATTPLAATVLHGIAVWAWHVPAWFTAAVEHPAIHELQHASFLASALLFWWATLRQRSAAGRGVAVAAMAATMLHTGALGALLVFSERAWYPNYALADQQLGGLLMWLPGGLLYVALGLFACTRWIGYEGGARQEPTGAS